MAEQVAFPLKPGVWSEISQVKNREDFPEEEREQRGNSVCEKAFMRRSSLLSRNSLNKVKTGVPQLSSHTISSGDPSLAPLYLLVHPSFMYAISVSLVCITPKPSGAPLSLRNSFSYSASD